MGVFSSLREKVISAPPAQHTLARKLSAEGGEVAQPFLKDECYVTG